MYFAQEEYSTLRKLLGDTREGSCLVFYPELSLVSFQPVLVIYLGALKAGVNKLEADRLADRRGLRDITGINYKLLTPCCSDPGRTAGG